MSSSPVRSPPPVTEPNLSTLTLVKVPSAIPVLDVQELGERINVQRIAGDDGANLAVGCRRQVRASIGPPPVTRPYSFHVKERCASLA